jgi:hypothetical protein
MEMVFIRFMASCLLALPCKTICWGWFTSHSKELTSNQSSIYVALTYSPIFKKNLEGWECTVLGYNVDTVSKEK